MTPAMRASRMLGWLSFAIGAAELLAPRKVARAVGMNEERTGLLRAYGVREVVAGVGSHSVYPVPALWSRVAGDVLDIATVAMAADRNDQGKRSRNTWIAIAVLAGVTAVDALVASRMAAETAEEKGEPKDYSSRSGFPQGAAAARGAGIVGDAMAGKAGGAAAGDSSPAGEAQSGRTSTDLAGASRDDQRASGPATRDGQGGSSSQQSGFIGSGQGMSQESEQAIPRPTSYTPA